MEIIMTLKKVTYAMLVIGVLLAPLGVSAKHPYPDERNGVDRNRIFTVDIDSPFPDQSTSSDYGIRTSKADNESPFPDQSTSNDYGIRISKADDDSAFPDQSTSIDYGVREAV